MGLVYDMPDSMKPISNKELELWGVTFYEALEAARENIRQLPPQIIGPKEGEGVYVFTTNDGYDSSRLIILDLIRQFQVKGDYIAMAPGREMLIVAGSEDTPGLEAMIALAKKAFEQPRTVSGVALRLAGDEWVSWMPEADHPLFDEFRKIRMLSSGQDYSEQKELLDRLHEKTGEDVFVASYSVMQHKDTGHQHKLLRLDQGHGFPSAPNRADRFGRRRSSTAHGPVGEGRRDCWRYDDADGHLSRTLPGRRVSDCGPTGGDGQRIGGFMKVPTSDCHAIDLDAPTLPAYEVATRFIPASSSVRCSR